MRMYVFSWLPMGAAFFTSQAFAAVKAEEPARAPCAWSLRAAAHISAESDWRHRKLLDWSYRDYRPSLLLWRRYNNFRQRYPLLCQTLAEQLARQTREAELYRPLDRNRVECFACGHRCPIPPGFAGVCKVRFNRDGKLYAPYGYVNAVCSRPHRKEALLPRPAGDARAQLRHAGLRPALRILPELGHLAGAARLPLAARFHRPSRRAELVESGAAPGRPSVVSTYNEPLITAEWAVAVFREAKAAGLTTGFVSNGNATPEVLEYIRPWVDLYKVDLKSFDDRRYHELGGRIGPILDSIRRIHQLGFWLEVVTLVVPGFNDSDRELGQIAEFLAGISPDIPWHVTAFHQDYKMTGPRDTPAKTLMRAAQIGRAAGLRFVYAGNLPGSTERLENTYCPGCGVAVIERRGFRVLSNRLAPGGRCPDCGTAIPGRLGNAFRPDRRGSGSVAHPLRVSHGHSPHFAVQRCVVSGDEVELERLIDECFESSASRTGPIFCRMAWDSWFRTPGRSIPERWPPRSIARCGSKSPSASCCWRFRIAAACAGVAVPRTWRDRDAARRCGD